MDTFMAWAMAQDARANGNKMKVFDWDKAAETIKEHFDDIDNVHAYLEHDEGNTVGCIFSFGSPIYDKFAYLASIWATPILEISFINGLTETIDCWKYQEDTPGWDAKTMWPESALDILGMVSDDVMCDDILYIMEDEG